MAPCLRHFLPPFPRHPFFYDRTSPPLPPQLLFGVSSSVFLLLHTPTHSLSFPFPSFLSSPLLSCAYLEQAVVSGESRSITAYH